MQQSLLQVIAQLPRIYCSICCMFLGNSVAVAQPLRWVLKFYVPGTSLGLKRPSHYQVCAIWASFCVWRIYADLIDFILRRPSKSIYANACVESPSYSQSAFAAFFHRRFHSSSKHVWSCFSLSLFIAAF